jgi:hypothetical protein
MLPYILTMLLALLAVAIAYRVNPLHKLVFGGGSARLNRAAGKANDDSATMGVK